MNFIYSYLNKQDSILIDNDIKYAFKLPIQLIDNCLELNENIIDDLELQNYKNNEDNSYNLDENLYYTIINPDNFMIN